MTATTSLRERLDYLADDCRESAAMCNVDTAEGQHWSRLAVELENIASALSTPPAGEWMPIATAPKDGQRILLANASGGRFIGRYEHGEGWLDDSSRFRDPTHWQPLPPPPATQEVG